jgi:hypothetical protein
MFGQDGVKSGPEASSRLITPGFGTNNQNLAALAASWQAGVFPRQFNLPRDMRTFLLDLELKQR